jgi:hypothetical protein
MVSIFSVLPDCQTLVIAENIAPDKIRKLYQVFANKIIIVNDRYYAVPFLEQMLNSNSSISMLEDDFNALYRIWQYNWYQPDLVFHNVMQYVKSSIMKFWSKIRGRFFTVHTRKNEQGASDEHAVEPYNSQGMFHKIDSNDKEVDYNVFGVKKNGFPQLCLSANTMLLKEIKEVQPSTDESIQSTVVPYNTSSILYKIESNGKESEYIVFSARKNEFQQLFLSADTMLLEEIKKIPVPDGSLKKFLMLISFTNTVTCRQGHAMLDHSYWENLEQLHQLGIKNIEVDSVSFFPYVEKYNTVIDIFPVSIEPSTFVEDVYKIRKLIGGTTKPTEGKKLKNILQFIYQNYRFEKHSKVKVEDMFIKYKDSLGICQVDFKSFVSVLGYFCFSIKDRDILYLSEYIEPKANDIKTYESQLEPRCKSNVQLRRDPKISHLPKDRFKWRMSSKYEVVMDSL